MKSTFPLLLVLLLGACDCNSAPTSTESDATVDGRMDGCVGNACGTADSGCVGLACCSPGRICGSTCCGENAACEGGQCVAHCGAGEAVCGDAQECCASGEVCAQTRCVAPGIACSRNFDCELHEYCEVELGRCLPLSESNSCAVNPPPQPFAIEQAWRWTGEGSFMPTFNNVVAAPMAAPLSDTNGDGRIGAGDIAIILFPASDTGDPNDPSILRAISGRDGTQVWPSSEPGYRVSTTLSVAVADFIATSPGPEIAVCEIRETPGNRLLILAANGSVLQRFPDVECNHHPSFADVDNDGDFELLTGSGIVSSDGSQRTSTGALQLAVNIDSDAALEYLGFNVFDDDFARRASLGFTWGPAVADLNWDGRAELLSSMRGSFLLGYYSLPDGTSERSVSVPSQPRDIRAYAPGPATVANLDPDPELEIIVVSTSALSAYNHDGSLLWQVPADESTSGMTGATAFDFDGDGRLEVVYADQATFRVLRGQDGSVLFSECHASGTLFEYPIVADIDGDGSANIVKAQHWANACTGPAGVRSYRHPQGQWSPTRNIWNQYAYHIANIGSDLRPLQTPVVHWRNPRTNAFRVQLADVHPAADVVVESVVLTSSQCSAEQTVRVTLRNRGAAALSAGAQVSLSEMVNGTDVDRDQEVLNEALFPGQVLRLDMTLPAATSTSMRQVTVRVVAQGECDSSNNSASAELRCSSIE